VWSWAVEGHGSVLAEANIGKKWGMVGQTAQLFHRVWKNVTPGCSSHECISSSGQASWSRPLVMGPTPTLCRTVAVMWYVCIVCVHVWCVPSVFVVHVLYVCVCLVWCVLRVLVYVCVCVCVLGTTFNFSKSRCFNSYLILLAPCPRSHFSHLYNLKRSHFVQF
jgi:hypothetical protein